MKKTLIKKRLIDSPLISEEELKEQQYWQREYGIECLRKKIKNDVKLFSQTPHIAGDKFNFYREYLLEQIEQSVEELKELVKQNNE